MIRDLVIRLKGAVDAATARLPSMLDAIKAAARTAAVGLVALGLAVAAYARSAVGGSVASARLLAATLQMRAMITAAKTVAVMVGAVAALGAALSAASGQAAEFIVQQKQLADGMGLSFRRLQQLTFATAAYGVDAQGTGQLLGDLADRALAVREGNEGMAEDFRSIGVSVRDLKDADPVTLFRLVADGLQRTAGDTNSTGAAIRLLGGDATKLLPLLRQGSAGLDELGRSARRSGVIVSDQAAAAARKYAHQLHLLDAQVSGLSAQISVALVPATSALVSELSEIVRVNTPRIIKLVELAARGLEAAVVALVGPLQDLVTLLTLGTLAKALPMIASGFWAMALGAQAAAGSVFALLTAFATTIAPVLLLGAVIDDVLTFFRGGPSATGALVDGLKQLFEWAMQFDVFRIYVGFVSRLAEALVFLGSSAIGRLAKDMNTLWLIMKPFADLLGQIVGYIGQIGAAGLGQLAGLFGGGGGATRPVQVVDLASIRAAAAAGFSSGRGGATIEQRVDIAVSGATGEQVAHTIRRELRASQAEALAGA
jgi:hypothetical protein